MSGELSHNTLETWTRINALVASIQSNALDCTSNSATRWLSSYISLAAAVVIGNRADAPEAQGRADPRRRGPPNGGVIVLLERMRAFGTHDTPNQCSTTWRRSFGLGVEYSNPPQPLRNVDYGSSHAIGDLGSWAK